MAVLLVACLPVVQEMIVAKGKLVEPLETQRGLIYLPSGMAAQYEAAIHLMQAAAKEGKYALSVPEDTSLYFLSGTHCPGRVYLFTPGVTAPGKPMDLLINDIAKSRPQYLIWAKRPFPEYGVPEFGRDFDRELGDYFRSHFGPVASLPNKWWSATIWERTSEVSNP
jgi:hypothetical protein